MVSETLTEEQIEQTLKDQLEESGGDEFLTSHGIKHNMRQIAEYFKIVLDSKPGVLYGSAQDTLTSQEIEVLRSGGVNFDRVLKRDFAVETAARFAILAERSLPSTEVAILIKRSAGRIRQLVANREIYSFNIGKKRLIPLFQFRENEPIPNISEVNKSIPPTLHPVGVEQWYHQKNSELCTDDAMETVKSPLEWLTEGRDPAIVCFLAENL